MAAIGSCWAQPSWTDDVWADGTWAGSVTPPAPVVVATHVGGQRVGHRRLTRQRTAQGRTVPVDGTLYRQMFPNAQEPKEPPAESTADPIALLRAWMALDD